MSHAHDVGNPDVLKSIVRPGARLIDSLDGVVFWTEEPDCTGTPVQVVRVVLGRFLAVRLGPFDSKAGARRCVQVMTEKLYGEIFDDINIIAQDLNVEINNEF